MCCVVKCALFILHVVYFFFFKQKTAYEMRISDWSSDVCSSDLLAKMKTYAKVTKQTLTNIAEECELTVQSIEGHEKLRKAWEAREAARPPEPLPAAEPAKTQPEGDKLRRVWN